MPFLKKRLQILIVDDSRIFRSLLEEILSNDPDFEVVGSVGNGLKALEFIRNRPPDLVTLDVEMPEMNGLETLKKIQEINDGLPEDSKIGVIMVSSMTIHGAKVTIEALSLGAFDFVPKPEKGSIDESRGYLKKELLGKISCFAAKKLKKLIVPTIFPPPNRPFKPLREVKQPYQAIFIGASTGGPKALSVLLPQLTKFVDMPIFVATHMPPFFTQSLAESLDKICKHGVVEAKGDEVVEKNRVFVAPGGKHLLVRKLDQNKTITVVNTQPSEDGCCPSVNMLFRSAATSYGNAAIAIILTGMGSDGTKGLKPLKRSGAMVIAQDEKTSVVWGMPGNAVASGLVDKILPLDKIAMTVRDLISE